MTHFAQACVSSCCTGRSFWIRGHNGHRIVLKSLKTSSINYCRGQWGHCRGWNPAKSHQSAGRLTSVSGSPLISLALIFSSDPGTFSTSTCMHPAFLSLPCCLVFIFFQGKKIPYIKRKHIFQDFLLSCSLAFNDAFSDAFSFTAYFSEHEIKNGPDPSVLCF